LIDVVNQSCYTKDRKLNKTKGLAKMKNVMTRAWEIAKQGQKKFGGKVKEFFAIALKMAWKEIKKMAKVIKNINERIILTANHDTFEYTVEGERNGKIFWKREGIKEDDKKNEAYAYLKSGKGINTVSFYKIKDGVKTFIETQNV